MPFYQQSHSIFIRHPFFNSAKQIEAILDEDQAESGVVIYTMNDKELRKHLAQQEKKRDLIMLDMLDPSFKKSGERYKSQPLLSSGLES